MLIQTNENNVTIIPLSEFESEDDNKKLEKMQDAQKIGFGTAIKTKSGKLFITAADSIAKNIIPAANIAGQAALSAAQIAGQVGQVAVPAAITLGNAALNLTTNVVIPIGVAVANNVLIPVIVRGTPIVADLVIRGASWSLYKLTDAILGGNIAKTTKPLSLRKQNLLVTMLRLQEAERIMGPELWKLQKSMERGQYEAGQVFSAGHFRAESMYRAIHTLKDIQDSKSQGNSTTITKTVFNCDCSGKEEKFTYDCKCTDEVTSLPQVMINEKMIDASLMAWKKVRTFQPYNRRKHTSAELFKMISDAYKGLAKNVKDIAGELESNELKEKLEKISEKIEKIERLRSHYNKDQDYILPPSDVLLSPLTSEENKGKDKVVFTELPNLDDIEFENKIQKERFKWENLVLRPFHTVFDKKGNMWRPMKAKKEDDNIEFVMQQVRYAISDILDTRAIPRIEGLNQMLRDCVTQYLIQEQEEKKAMKPKKMSGEVSGGKGNPSPVAKLFLQAQAQREAQALKKTT